MLNLRWLAETLRLAKRCRNSYLAARKRGFPGERFYHLGRAIGWRLLLKGDTKSRGMLMCPVNITRYIEFDFAERALSQGPAFSTCLDMSSPFLFSFYYTRKVPSARVLIANPSKSDTARTAGYAHKLRWPGISTAQRGVETFQDLPAASFDAIWSISVLEHIGPEHGEDRGACRALWRLLKPGGRLVLTLPTDKTCWEEFRKSDSYGVRSAPPDPRGYFFQRFYDEAAIRERIISSVGVEPLRVEWFGVRQPGHFHAYIARWQKGGMEEVLNDPLDIALNYQPYTTFAEMPGEGVCGLVFQKPNTDT